MSSTFIFLATILYDFFVLIFYLIVMGFYMILRVLAAVPGFKYPFLLLYLSVMPPYGLPSWMLNLRGGRVFFGSNYFADTILPLGYRYELFLKLLLVVRSIVKSVILF